MSVIPKKLQSNHTFFVRGWHSRKHSKGKDAKGWCAVRNVSPV